MIMQLEEDQDFDHFFDDFILRARGHIACITEPITDEKRY